MKIPIGNPDRKRTLHIIVNSLGTMISFTHPTGSDFIGTAATGERLWSIGPMFDEPAPHRGGLLCLGRLRAGWMRWAR